MGEESEAQRGEDSALASFILLLSFLDRPADPEQLRHLLGKGSVPLDADDLLRLAKKLDVQARKVQVKPGKLDRMPLPAIALRTDGEYVVLLQATQGKVLVFGSTDERPRAIERAQFEASFSGVLVLMTTRERIAGRQRSFDVSWFIPALVRYRHILRDVLIASFFLQLLALVSPLFFQIVIDKVLVHKGLTTLEVLAIGLIVVFTFDVAIGGLRTYLFAHTTSRVDAELGSKLFSHLTHLPLAYFQARRVGDSVARA
jgi:ATP-binding cassette, subfamily B, bacterial HlyB/CyaB